MPPDTLRTPPKSPLPSVPGIKWRKRPPKPKPDQNRNDITSKTASKPSPPPPLKPSLKGTQRDSKKLEDPDKVTKTAPPKKEKTSGSVCGFAGVCGVYIRLFYVRFFHAPGLPSHQSGQGLVRLSRKLDRLRE
eukprot:214819-Amorphochlora_amoeboformis.AAC.1